MALGKNREENENWERRSEEERDGICNGLSVEKDADNIRISSGQSQCPK